MQGGRPERLSERPRASERLSVAIDGRVISDHFPGIGRYVYHLVEALAQLDTTATGPSPGAGSSPAPALRIVLLHQTGQRDSRYDLAALGALPAVQLWPVDAPVFGLSSQWRIPAALRASGAQVWHATYWLGAWRTGIPSVLTLYDLIGTRLPGSVPTLKSKLLALALRQALRSADGLLTISEAARRDILAGAGAGKPVQVTPLAADARFRPQAPRVVAELRERLALPARYVLYLGINKPHKNLLTLIEAWGRLAAEAPALLAGPGGAQLVIAGRWDPRYEAPRRLAAGLAPDARPRFLGPVAEADLPALYSGATAFAFPSRYEGFGLPPLEAMACGTPVLAAEATSLPEVVGDAGLLIDPEDPAAWAAALRRLLSDPDLAGELARRGRERAAGFTWLETARLTREVYGDLAPPA